MIPVTFSGCRGWLHPGRSAQGVVLVGTFGFEELCSRRTLHVLARHLSEAGFPVLRFDLKGVGDSCDDPDDAATLTEWRREVRDAVALLQRQTGVENVALIGLRLGAALAAAAACELPAVSAVGLLAPVSLGRTYLRELTALSRVMSAGAESSSAAAPGLDVAGFRLPSSFLDELRKIDLAKTLPSGKRLLWMANGGSPALSTLQGTAAAAEDLTIHDFEGYDRMMCDPTASEVPSAAIAKIATWLRDGPSGMVQAGGPVTTTPPSGELVGDSWIESAEQFGRGRDLVGILCRPRNAIADDAVIFLNAGAIHHAGWARMHVELARDLAAAGVMSLRMDLRGLGDSGGATQTLPGLYALDASEDVQAALDVVTTAGASRITVVGNCSGAYQAFHATRTDPRISRMVLVNQLCFIWGPTYAMQLKGWKMTKAVSVRQQIEAVHDGSPANSFRSAAFGAPALQFLWQAAKGVLERLRRLGATLDSALRPNRVAQWFREMSRRGVHTCLVYSAGDAGLDELARYMGPDGERARVMPGVEMRIIADADHTLTPPLARQTFGRILKECLAR